MYEKIKRFLGDDSIFYSLLLILVGVTAFGLGKHSIQATKTVSQEAVVSMALDPTKKVPVVKLADETAIGTYVASKNGSRYHLPSCPGANQMKEENKVWFDSKVEAEASGYTPAANCKGL